MNKAFRFGSLLVGLGLFIGCDAPATSPQVEPSMEAPVSEQEMTDGGETVVEESVEVTEEVAPESAAPAPGAASAPAPPAEEAAPAPSDAP